MTLQAENKKFKYEQIIDHYSKAIQTGNITCGDKLPSLRKTAHQFNCAISVVMQAYQELEVINVIRGVEKSGYFALPPRQVTQPKPERYKHTLSPGPSTPNSYTGKIVEIGMDSSILPLGCAVPDMKILPLAKLKKSITGLTKSSPHLFCEYAPESGSPFLRQQINKIMLDRGVAVSKEEILITNGCTEALAIAIKSCTEPGDTIAVESPTYFGLLTLLDSLGRNVLEIPSSADQGLELTLLEKAVQKNTIKACIFTANFQNPLGSVMPINKRQHLLYLAEKFDFTLIEDDIYGECAFDASVHPPAKQLDNEGNVIYCSSFSKTVSPGVRTGWLIGGKHHQRCREIKLAETLGGSHLLQHSVGDFLLQGGYNFHMRNFRKHIAKQSFAIKKLLMEHLPENTKITHPTGGYFLWLELPEEVDTMSLFEKALQQKIGIVPGPVFSCNRDMFTNCLRISCGSPVTEATEAGINKLGSIIAAMQR